MGIPIGEQGIAFDRFELDAWIDDYIAKHGRQASVYSVRPSRTFEQAPAKFVVENQHKRGLHSDIGRLNLLMPWIGDIAIDKMHVGSPQPWIDHRRKQGTAIETINHGLKVVRRILNLASTEWVDEFRMKWLQ